jgi:hypothetical protein
VTRHKEFMPWWAYGIMASLSGAASIFFVNYWARGVLLLMCVNWAASAGIEIGKQSVARRNPNRYTRRRRHADRVSDEELKELRKISGLEA